MAETVSVGITGAAGYIGSRVAANLLERGHEVRALDNFDLPKVETIDGHPIDDVDVRDRAALREALDGVDAVMHLAAISGVTDCDDRQEAAFDTNVGGTENVAWLCREWGVPLMFPASMAIIGDPVDFPITADHPRAPLNHYGRTKHMSEQDIHALAEGAFPALVLMKSNLYGHHEVGDRRIGKSTVINTFVERALAGEPMSVHEPGTQARDFLHVEDVAQMYEHALDHLLDADDGARTLPIGSGDCRSVLDLAELVRRLAAEERGADVDIELVENPRAAETAVDDFAVDTAPAREVIGFEAERTVENTVRAMLQP